MGKHDVVIAESLALRGMASSRVPTRLSATAARAPSCKCRGRCLRQKGAHYELEK